MKRNFFLFPAILMILVSLACQMSVPSVVSGSGSVATETRKVSGFNAVSLENMGDVFITIGDIEKLTIEAEDNLLPYLTSEVQDGVLKLGVTRGKNINPTRPITFNLTVRTLNSITLAGSGNFFVAPFEADKTTVMLAGSGNIELDELVTDAFKVTIAGSGNVSVDELTAKSVDATVSGSGNIRLTGKALSQDLSIAGSGDYLAGDFETETARIDIAGSGNVTVWTKEKLTTSINGSGDIRYYGKPSIDQSGNGSGKLTSLGEK